MNTPFFNKRIVLLLLRLMPQINIKNHHQIAHPRLRPAAAHCCEYPPKHNRQKDPQKRLREDDDKGRLAIQEQAKVPWQLPAPSSIAFVPAAHAVYYASATRNCWSG